MNLCHIPCILLAQITVACSIYIGILNAWCHVSVKIYSGTTVRDKGGVVGERRVVGVPNFHSWGKCTMP